MNGLRGAFSDFSARWNLALVATNDLCVWLSEKNDMQKSVCGILNELDLPPLPEDWELLILN